MIYEINEVTPQDSYIVIINKPIEISNINNLIELYQPIIGIEAFSFYMTLCNHIAVGQKGYSNSCLHRQLMSKMNLSFPTIIKARKVLEAVGLLETKRYKHKNFGEYIFKYTINPPLEPKCFYQSDILSLLLVNRLGKKQYKKLKEKILGEWEWNQGDYSEEKEITKSFDEVFDSILVSDLQKSIDSETSDLISTYDDTSENKSDNAIKLGKKYLDIEFIKGMVSNLYQLDKVLDRKTIFILQELAFLYQFSEMEIINLLNDQTIYNSTGKIDEDFLRSRAREKYLYTQKEITIVDNDKLPKQSQKKELNDGNKEQRHIWVLENYSPVELIQQYQGEGKIPDADIKLIETLIYDYKLSSGVVNVLIEYILLSNDYKLPKNLVEKIAGQWKRLRINTVKDALEVAKKEHKLYSGWKDNSNKSKYTTKENSKSGKKTNIKKEKVPEYIVNQDKKYNDNTQDKEVDSATLANIDRLLKNLGEK